LRTKEQGTHLTLNEHDDDDDDDEIAYLVQDFFFGLTEHGSFIAQAVSL